MRIIFSKPQSPPIGPLVTIFNKILKFVVFDSF